MSAGKLGRFAGLVLALAIVFGGLSDGSMSVDSSQAEVLNILNWEWS